MKVGCSNNYKEMVLKSARIVAISKIIAKGEAFWCYEANQVEDATEFYPPPDKSQIFKIPGDVS